MTLILRPTTAAERRYNYSQIRTRGTIERTFRIWKRRFPCLNKLRTKLSTSLTVIDATAVLHNITRKLNDTFDVNFTHHEEDEGDLSPTAPTSTGKATRLAIINSHFE